MASVGTKVRGLATVPNDFPLNPTGYPYKSPFDYIDGKRIDDNVPQSLWRIHDKVYDLTSFEHPGGQQFLTLTKGTDITELFETHHLDMARVRKMLPKYEIELTAPLAARQCPLTFHPDGFYCTLRKKIWRDFGSSIKKDTRTVTRLGPSPLSKVFADALALLSVTLVCVGGQLGDYRIAIAAGLLNGVFIGVGHNFLHQKDNFRRHYMDLSGYSSAEFRMHHVLSHHPYTNTVIDAELNQWLPEISFFPTDPAAPPSKSSLRSILTLLLVLPLALPKIQLQRFYSMLTGTWPAERPDWYAQLIPIAQIVFLSNFGNSLLLGLALWMTMLFTTSGFFLTLNYNFGPHFNDECWHQGDTLDSTDWGILQVMTSVERSNIEQHNTLINNLQMIPSFGLHHLHHLFPTIDATHLTSIVAIFEETCSEFNVAFTLMTLPELARGLWKCLGDDYKNNERCRNGIYEEEKKKQK